MKKSVLITTSWDDGHKLDLKLANLLKRYGIKGTFYVSPQNREFPPADLLNTGEVLRLNKDFEIGAHTLTHPRLSLVSLAEAEKEIIGSKLYLEKLIGKPVISFCYPGGDYNQNHVHQVKKSGFRVARTINTFSFDLGPDPFALPTTIHAYDHWTDVMKIMRYTNFNLIKFLQYFRHWDVLAMAMFDRVQMHGGIFHLWGHSWEIEEHHDWERLENVLKYISRRPRVRYVVNGDLI